MLYKTQPHYFMVLIIPISFQIPITLHKDKEYDEEGREVLKCGFKIGGGIDQDFRKSPQGYSDNVRTQNQALLLSLSNPIVSLPGHLRD